MAGCVHRCMIDGCTDVRLITDWVVLVNGWNYGLKDGMANELEDGMDDQKIKYTNEGINKVHDCHLLIAVSISSSAIAAASASVPGLQSETNSPSQAKPSCLASHR